MCYWVNHFTGSKQSFTFCEQRTETCARFSGTSPISRQSATTPGLGSSYPPITAFKVRIYKCGSRKWRQFGFSMRSRCERRTFFPSRWNASFCACLKRPQSGRSGKRERRSGGNGYISWARTLSRLIHQLIQFDVSRRNTLMSSFKLALYYHLAPFRNTRVYFHFLMWRYLPHKLSKRQSL